MKRGKRFFAIALVPVFCAGMVPATGGAAGGDHPFADVPDGTWYSEAVRYVYEKGLMSGTAATAFSPEDPLLRGMLVTILYRRDGEPRVREGGFDGVEAGLYYSDAVAWASVNGIV